VSTPAEIAEFLTAVLPAVNRPERVEIIAPLRALGPTAFDQLTAGARAAVGPVVWAEILAAVAS
jgi:hypothetical protein